nr:immunoglobulin heavy chain junction region [Mus musculus]
CASMVKLFFDYW